MKNPAILSLEAQIKSLENINSRLDAEITNLEQVEKAERIRVNYALLIISFILVTASVFCAWLDLPAGGLTFFAIGLFTAFQYDNGPY